MEANHPQQGSHHRHSTRLVVAWIAAALAGALTLFTGYLVYDSLTGDYVGGEVGTVWVITSVVGVLAVAAWIAAVGLLRSARGR